MSKGRYANALERAGVAAEDYPTRFHPEQRGTILLGVLAGLYGKEEGDVVTAVGGVGGAGEVDEEVGVGEFELVGDGGDAALVEGLEDGGDFAAGLAVEEVGDGVDGGELVVEGGVEFDFHECGLWFDVAMLQGYRLHDWLGCLLV
jgi:hypothetical protein